MTIPLRQSARAATGAVLLVAGLMLLPIAIAGIDAPWGLIAALCGLAFPVMFFAHRQGGP